MDTKPDSENLQEIDLSSLASLDFNPAWAAADAKKINFERHGQADSRNGNRRPPRKEFKHDGASRDRRPPRAPRKDNAPESAEAPARENRRDDAKPHRGNPRRNKHQSHAPAAEKRPLVRVADVVIYPEEKPFTVLAKAIKNSARTYVLFEIAKIIVEKPERFNVVIAPLQKKDKAGKPIPSETPLPPFYVSLPDGMPFLNEQDALAHVLKNHLDAFFNCEEVEIEAPKGNFTMVAKCGFTGEVIAPPNYHGYQQALRDHHAANFPNMAFEKFMSRVETVNDPELVNAWIEKVKKVTRYTLKDRREGEPESFDGLGAAKAFILASRKDAAVRQSRQVRITGTLVDKMPLGPLKSTVDAEIAFQRKFPLNTANGFRGRLRHLGFSLYKKGAKGVTMVCGVKRKFRTPDSVFSDTIQRIFDFLEKNPGTNLKDLPAQMLGIEASVAPASVEGEAPANPIPAEESAAEKELIGTVRWLVNEGYVSEMADGKLYAHPVMTEAQAKAAANAEQPIERPEIPNVECPGDNIGEQVPEAPEPLIKVIGSLAPEEPEQAPTEA